MNLKDLMEKTLGTILYIKLINLNINKKVMKTFRREFMSILNRKRCCYCLMISKLSRKRRRSFKTIFFNLFKKIKYHLFL
jgi:hypothetical protein